MRSVYGIHIWDYWLLVIFTHYSSLITYHFFIMACVRCGARGAQPPAQKSVSDINMETSDIKTFVTNNGWKYQGDCSCRNSFGIYTNADYPNYQVWVSKNGNIMQVRHKSESGRDTWVKSQAGIGNFITEYLRFFKP